MADLYYIEDDSNIASMVKEYLEQKNFSVDHSFRLFFSCWLF